MSPNEHLEGILEVINPVEDLFTAVRERRDEVRQVGARYEGVKRHYGAGSIMHATAIGNGLDADGGIVLDRRSHPDLGPDDEGPKDTVYDVRDFLRDNMKVDHQDIRFRVADRAIKITYNEPIDGSLTRDDDNDPTVDLIVALRHAQQGLWIPKKIHGANTWDRSDPEYHNTLFSDGSESLRKKRQRTARLIKAWNKQYSRPGLSSFNLEVLVWEAVESGQGLAAALLATYRHAVSSLAERRSEDPAGVSGSIRLLVRKSIVVDRLRIARDNMQLAIDSWEADDDVAVQAALASVLWDYVERPRETKSRIADHLRHGTTGMGLRDGRLTTVSTAGAAVARKEPRSFGDRLK